MNRRRKGGGDEQAISGWRDVRIRRRPALKTQRKNNNQNGMKIQRTKNAARNNLFDGMLKTLNMVIPFIMRSIMLNCLGVQYLGLNGLFRSILSFLNLAELGVGSAMVFSMYKPIAEDDGETICALLRLYRTLYRAIGLFIAAASLALTPFLKTLVGGSVPSGVNLYILYFMHLGGTVLTYWVFAYKRSLLDAHQRNDLGSKVSLVIYLLEYTLKISSLILLRNYYVYLAIQLTAHLAINLFTAVRVTKVFPQYVPRGKLPKEKVLGIVRRVRDLFTAKFSSFVFKSADTLVISSFMGLTALAVYQNYSYIIVSLQTLLEVVIAACVADVSNSLITESKEKNYRDMERFSLLFGWLMAVASAMLLCLYQPFMVLWMGRENTLSTEHVFCFVIYFHAMGLHKMVSMFKGAAGIWQKDRWRPLTGALVNLALNLATVKTLGLYGILLSSVVSIAAVQIPWLFHNLFHTAYPHEYQRRYARLFCGFTAAALISCGASWGVCSLFHMSEWPALFLNGFVGFIIPNAMFFAVYGRNPLFKESMARARRIISKSAARGKM